MILTSTHRERKSHYPCLRWGLGRPLPGRGTWTGSWRMKRTSLGRWGNSCLPGEGQHKQRCMELRCMCSGYWELVEFLWAWWTKREKGKARMGKENGGGKSKPRRDLWHVESFSLHLESMGSISSYETVLMKLKTTSNTKIWTDVTLVKKLTEHISLYS